MKPSQVKLSRAAAIGAAVLLGLGGAAVAPTAAHAASSQRMLLDGPFYLINVNGKVPRG